MPKQIDRLHLRKLRETWLDVNLCAMTEEMARIYKAQKKAVDLYIDGVPTKTITNHTGISNTRICQLVNKCAKPIPGTGEVPGYDALIPGKVIQSSRTKMEILFDKYTKIGEKIRGVYFGERAYTSERCANLRTLHGIFIRECKSAGIQDYEFPFNTKGYGYENLRQYMLKVCNTEMTQAIKRQGKDQMQKFNSTGYGRAYNINPKAPFDIVQIDGHILDILTVVTTTSVTGEAVTDIASRMWVLAVIDVATRCIIGYSVSPHFNYNQFDVLEAIKASIEPHRHEKFRLKSLPYPEGGGFPSEAIPETRWAAFNTIMLDNAKSHLATHVGDKITNQLGCVMNFGSVATPETRGIVERFFGTLERSGFHRLPNTTGSNALDPKRRDPEKQAVKVKLTYEDCCEILESLIAEYNNSAHSSLIGLTPLEAMESKIRNACTPIYVIPQKERVAVEKLTHFTVECTLRGSYESGSQLRVHYEGGIYHAVDIKIPMSMRGEKCFIEVDPDDLRMVKLYRSDCTYFCDMVCAGEFGRIKHSLKTRRMANKARRDRMTPDSIFNPDISRLTEELAERGKKDRNSRTKAATIIREAQGGLDPKKPAEVVPFVQEPPIPTPQPRRKAVGEYSRDKRELTPDEIIAIFAKYPGDAVAAINEINRLSRGG